jgi:molybdenum cofactor cytidylyltransferase
MVCWAAEALVSSGLTEVWAVLGCEGSGVRRALGGLVTRFVDNPDYATGMASSIVAGVSVLRPEFTAVVIALADMPRISSQVVSALVQGFEGEEKGIVVPTYRTRRGHPVLFDLKRYRSRLLALSGDEGARSILAAHADDVLELPVNDAGVLADVDTPADYEREGAVNLGKERE